MKTGSNPLSKRKIILIFKHLAIFSFIAVYSFVIGCPLQRLTGITCPGCGLSRAFISVIKFDFSAAFSFHPLFWTVPFFTLYACHISAWHLPGNRKVVIILGIILAFAFIVVWIIRLFRGDPVTAFSFENSLTYKIIEATKK